MITLLHYIHSAQERVMARTKKTEISKSEANRRRKQINKVTKKKVERKPKAAGAPVETEKKERRAHRWRPGTVALREIRKQQKSTKYCLRKGPLQRIVRAIASNDNELLRFQKKAFTCVQDAVEHYLINLLRDSNLIALHANRVSLGGNDIEFLLRLRRDTPASVL